MQLDHLAVAGLTLDGATAHAEQALGLPLELGGEHAVFHTHNALLGLADGLYLEAIAVNPAAPAPGRARWFDLDRFQGAPRLSNWICRCTDLDATLASLPEGFGTPVDLKRGDLRWRMAVPEDGILPFDNCAPALMAWEGATHPAQRLRTSDARLKTLTVSHPQAATLRDMLAPHFVDARLRFETGPAKLIAAFDINGVQRILT
ncbi:MAG: VOC family protein [Pseudomonadota bacterium]